MEAGLTRAAELSASGQVLWPRRRSGKFDAFGSQGLKRWGFGHLRSQHQATANGTSQYVVGLLLNSVSFFCC